MSSVLILAYGNPLRADDAIAWRAAEELERRLPSTLAEIVCLHQLTPELADRASRASAVVFLDAHRDGQPGTIRCEPVDFQTPARFSHDFSHQMTPQQIMALCGQLCSARPRAFVVSLSGQLFDFGEALSPAARAALPQFVSTVQELVERLGCAASVSASL